MKILQKTSIALALTLASTASNATLVTNGSFEAAGSSVCQAGATTLSGWVVSAGNIDVVNGLGNNNCGTASVPDGTNFVDLTGSFNRGAGHIYQDIATTVGTTYQLSFYFGGNADWQYYEPIYHYGNDGAVKSMDALINGSIAGTYSINTTGFAQGSYGWSQKFLTFTATTGTTRIGFNSLDVTGVYGPLLDGVNVSVDVPEPATLGVFSLGLLGLVASRRKQRA